MLTGNADQETAVRAINDGHIFRFLNKPCGKDALMRGLDDAVRQYRLQTAEKDLIENTLAGSVKLLSDVLAAARPERARHRERIRRWAGLLAREIDLPKVWELDLAVMLAPIGTVSVPRALNEKIADGEKLTPEELDLLDNVPCVGAGLVANIPRLENVARGIQYQVKNFDGGGFTADGIAGEDIPIIGRILRLLQDIADITQGHDPTTAVFDKLAKNRGRYDPSLLAAARRVLKNDSIGTGRDKSTEFTEFLAVSALRPGVTLLTDLTYPDGRLILKSGCELTSVQVQRIRAIHKIQHISEPVQVLYYGAS